MEKEWYFCVKYSKSFSWIDSRSWPRPPHPWTFDIIHRHYILCESSRRVIGSSQRQVPDNAYNTQKRFTSLLPAGFEPTIVTSDRPQTHSLYRAATRIGSTQLTTAYSRNDTNCIDEILSVYHIYNICGPCSIAWKYVAWEKLDQVSPKCVKLSHILIS